MDYLMEIKISQLCQAFRDGFLAGWRDDGCIAEVMSHFDGHKQMCQSACDGFQEARRARNEIAIDHIGAAIEWRFKALRGVSDVR